MTVLTNEALLQLTGVDAAKFLQGQTTADFLSAEPSTPIRGAFCDPKGRIIADFLALVVSPEDIWLRSRRPVAEALAVHLSKYLVFSKATLVLSDWQVMAKAGDAPAAAVLSDMRFAVPRGDHLAEYWQSPASEPIDGACSEARYRQHEIALGEARIEVNTMGRYLPQDLNFDLNGAVNFRKGCYTGQEIVARLHFRGQPKRRLYAACADGGSPLDAGATIVSQTSGKTLGSVVNTATDGEHTQLLIEAVESVFAQQPVAGDTGVTLAPVST